MTRSKSAAASTREVAEASSIPGPTEAGSRLMPWALLLFLGSGFSALIYELVWFQLLELVVGSSAVSLGILLSVFMGGLGLGSLLLAKLAPEREHPFRVYAFLELGLAIAGILVLFEIPLFGRLSLGSGSQGAASLIVRALMAGLSLLPPTVLMGATLPAIARWVRATPRGIGWLGRLYAGNIAGGILGCLLAGFFLLRSFDVWVAAAVAVAVNLCASALAFRLAARAPRSNEPALAAVPQPHRGRSIAPGVLWTIALSGLCALAGEVVWTRLLAMMLGPTVFTFSIILAVYLLGLGVGSGIGSLIARESPRPARALGRCQALLGIAIAWAAFMVNGSLPYWPPPFTQSPWITFQLDMARSLWALLPATVLWGASFPLALAAGASDTGDPARWVGRVYAANTLGSILGALVFTLWIIPSFGTHAAQQVMVALSMGAGLWLLGSPLARERRSAWGWLGALGGVALGVALVVKLPEVPDDVIALGRYVSWGMARPGGTANVAQDPRILYRGEGLTSSVAVSENGGVRLFHVSGKVEASTYPDDMRLQRMLGHLPALMQGAPRSVLVVGCGAGVTAGTFTRYPSVRRIVICEIEPLVPRRVAPYFAAENYGVVSDPRVEIVYDDARHYILTSREKFDVITSDPIHPWVSGSATLYSRDYFDLVRRHLNPGGTVSQWVPIYEAGEKSVRGEIATFLSVFPQATLWANRNHAGGEDLVMLGTTSQPAFDLDGIDQQWQSPEGAEIARSLKDVGFRTPLDLFGTYVGRGPDLAPWVAGAEVDRDPKPWLQYQAGLDSYTQQTVDVLAKLLPYRRFPEDLFVGSPGAKQALKRAGSGHGP